MFKALSGEWLLGYFPNSGGIIFVRSLMVSIILFLIVLIVSEVTDPRFGWRWPPFVFWSAVHERISWFGAIFAATYAALYARFASQWAYLANLYNQIMGASLAAKGRKLTPEQRTDLATWWAGFIEDADDLHLARKSSYAPIILYKLADPEVSEICAEWMVGGDRRLNEIRDGLMEDLPEADRERMSRLIKEYWNGVRADGKALTEKQRVKS